MIFLYILVVIIVNFTETAPRFIEGINTCFNTNLSGTQIFWSGLFIVFIIELLTGKGSD